MPTSFSADSAPLPISLAASPVLSTACAGALADLGDGPAESLHQLGVAVEARHQAVDDRRDVIEPRLEDQLRLDALDVELDPAEVHVDAHVELDEVEHLRLERDVRVEVVELEVDRVDPQLRHVEQDVRRPGRVLLLALHVAPVLAVGVVGLAARLLRRAQSAPFGSPAAGWSDRCGDASHALAATRAGAL